MSFGTEARKVRDGSLPYGRRINALACCVERYGPIGFDATFGYLEVIAGAYRRDEAALVRAVDALDASRRLWLAEQNAYVKRRIAAKNRGERSPASTDRGPGQRWYGDEKQAALFAIRFVLRHRGDGAAAEPAVARLAERCLDSGGVLTPAQHDRMAELRQRCERLRGQPDVEWPERTRAVQSLWLLHLITSAT